MANQIKTFVFATTAEDWAYTAGVNATGTYQSGSGNPAGALDIDNFGRNKVDTDGYWEWTGDYEDLGVEVGATINGYSSCAVDHSCTVYNVVDTLTSGVFSINDGTLRTLVDGVSLTETTAFATATQSGSISGLSLASTTAIVLRITSDSDNGNDAAAQTTILLDNVKITVDYTAGGGQSIVPLVIQQQMRN